MAQFRTDLHKIDSGQVFTRYEVNMMSDRLTPSGTITDAFGRLRLSQPFTLFKFQLERNGLTNTPFELTLCVAASINGSDIYASMDWEEVTR